jgi:hypothetical protein
MSSMTVNKRFLTLPGWIASVVMILVTLLWTFWGTAEMYHEGWYGSWINRLPYLIPVAVTLIPTLIAFRWPIPGAIIIISIGVFTFFFFGSGVALIGLTIVLVGGLFIVDSVTKHRRSQAGTPTISKRKDWRYLAVLSATCVIFLIVSAVNLPVVLTRQDDGNRGMRRIEGNCISLVWAPEGPGWNWRQPWGGYPSWHSIALYGIEPVGLENKPGYGYLDTDEQMIHYATSVEMTANNLCLYLSEDGKSLLDTPQHIWRMPTTDEIVRSLVRHGENAGCVWKGEIRRQAQCNIRPDKESPLWSTDIPVVYYWSADEYNQAEGYFVSYNGMVNAVHKLGGNPRHGYRCVKTP